MVLARTRQTAKRHPKATIAVAVAVLAGLTFVLVWFQPQTLFFGKVVDEDFPTAGPTTTGPNEAAPTTTYHIEEPEPPISPSDPDPGDEAEEPQPAGPIALSTGEFGSRNRYTVTGTATVFQLDDGSRVLRLEDFASTNGPDLYVYLTSANAGDDDASLDADFIDLGLLTGNIGNQNYTIPADVDLSRYNTVVIWCRRFTVGFGAADLVPQ